MCQRFCNENGLSSSREISIRAQFLLALELAWNKKIETPKAEVIH
jgi:hypothetical protein